MFPYAIFYSCRKLSATLSYYTCILNSLYQLFGATLVVIFVRNVVYFLVLIVVLDNDGFYRRAICKRIVFCFQNHARYRRMYFGRKLILYFSYQLIFLDFIANIDNRSRSTA